MLRSGYDMATSFINSQQLWLPVKRKPAKILAWVEQKISRLYLLLRSYRKLLVAGKGRIFFFYFSLRLWPMIIPVPLWISPALPQHMGSTKWSFKHEVTVSAQTVVQEAALQDRRWYFRRGIHMARRTGDLGFCTIVYRGREKCY